MRARMGFQDVEVTTSPLDSPNAIECDHRSVLGAESTTLIGVGRRPQSALPKHQERRFQVGLELEEVLMGASNHLVDLACGAVSAPDPDDLGRMTECETELVEISVLGEDDQSAIKSRTPDDVVIRALQGQAADVNGARDQVFEPPDQPERKVVIDEQLHPAEMDSRRRSRSAANARHARMSS